MKKLIFILLAINICAIEMAAQNNSQRVPASEIIVEAVPDQVYTGTPLTPDVVIRDGQKTLVKGTDYTLTYSANREIGKATVTIQGRGNYADTKDIYFNIVAKSLQVDPIADQIFKGEPISPTIVVKDGAKTLTKDRDFTVTYANNINVGTANVTITGKGIYSDTRQVTFNIVPKSMKDSRAAATSQQSDAATQTTRQQTTRPQPQDDADANRPRITQISRQGTNAN